MDLGGLTLAGTEEQALVSVHRGHGCSMAVGCVRTRQQSATCTAPGFLPLHLEGAPVTKGNRVNVNYTCISPPHHQPDNHLPSPLLCSYLSGLGGDVANTSADLDLITGKGTSTLNWEQMVAYPTGNTALLLHQLQCRHVHVHPLVFVIQVICKFNFAICQLLHVIS